MITKKCQLCGSKDLKIIIDLGYHPLADTFLKAEHLNDKEETFPLRVLMCSRCGYATLQYLVEPSARYQKVDYSYTTSNSPVAIKHFTDLAEQAIAKTGLKKNDLAIDIGSNDGTLLAAMKNKIGCRVIGVDPAANIAKIARKNGVPTVNDFFNKASVKKIKQQAGKPKVILAINVLNHTNNLSEFFQDMVDLLDPNGYFIFQAPYLLPLVQNTSFDTIYLEHISYFGIKPLVNFLKKFGLYMHYIEHNDYMAGSIRVYIKKTPAEKDPAEAFCRLEQKAKIYQAETYKNFMEQIGFLKFNLNRRLHQLKSRGEKIIGIGAATKGNTLLNYCRIDNSLIDYITDNSNLKINKVTPGSRIPIKRDASITPDIKYALILPWNIAAFLKNKLKHLNLKFIVPRIKK